MDDLRFEDPILLGLLAVLPLLLIWERWQARHSPTLQYSNVGYLAQAGWRTRVRWLPTFLRAATLALVAIALARPQSGEAEALVTTEGIDILLCLDVSSSMSANDMDPKRTRLEVAKEAAAEFIAGRPDDRIGLITFARYPDVTCPLTLDHRALAQILSAVTLVESEGPEDATGIGVALARAAAVLKESASKSKVAILFTDGEENVATAQTPEEIAPVHAAQLCAEIGVRVYPIAAGIGSQAPSGEWVALDTSQIERVAERTGGRFYEARQAGALERVYASINDLERVELEEPRYRIEEGFVPFVLAALVLAFARSLLRASALEVLP